MTATERRTIFKTQPVTDNFTKIENRQLLWHDQLTNNEKIVMGIAFSLPTEYIHYFTPSSILRLKDPKTGKYLVSREYGHGICAMRTAFTGLMNKGYARIVYRYSATGRRLTNTWHIYDRPICLNMAREPLYQKVEKTEDGKEIHHRPHQKGKVPARLPELDVVPSASSNFDTLMGAIETTRHNTPFLLNKYKEWLTPELLAQYRIEFKDNASAHDHADDLTGFAKHFDHWLPRYHFEIRLPLQNKQAKSMKSTTKPTAAAAPSTPAPVVAPAIGRDTTQPLIKIKTPVEILEDIFSDIQNADAQTTWDYFAARCAFFVKHGKRNDDLLTIKEREYVQNMDKRDEAARRELFDTIVKHNEAEKAYLVPVEAITQPAELVVHRTADDPPESSPPPLSKN